ncbi:MAG: hypothetical protein IJ007_05095 [Oscillospiraceae bacterium]|nr:hypothetical protein [Oscillospiraceae bacterium]
MTEMDIKKAEQTVAEALKNICANHSHDYYKWGDVERRTGFSVSEADGAQLPMIKAWLDRACRIRSFTPKAAFLVSMYKIAGAERRCYNNWSNFDHYSREDREKYAELAKEIEPVYRKAESECRKLFEQGGHFADGQLCFSAERTADEPSDGDFWVRITAKSGEKVFNVGIMSNYSFVMTANAMSRIADENYESITYAPKCSEGGIKFRLKRQGERFDVTAVFADGAEFTENMSRDRLRRFAAYFYSSEEFLNGKNNFWY